MMQNESKFDLLLQTLRLYRKIAIAFSGGVDSTLLLYAALKALGPENVTTLCARSTLNSKTSVTGSRMVFQKNFPHAAGMVEIEVSPLSWQDFVANDKDRCYYCKKRMYSTLQETSIAAGCTILADGTNCDDQKEGRPGLRAVLELQVITPLADVGLTKPEVRRLARKFSLSNFDLPSNSCLATRIPENSPITEMTLRVVELAEEFLHNLGFWGCRVRVQQACTIVEVQKKDIAVFVEPQTREKVRLRFLELQLAPVVLSLDGR
ncbi:MAG: ATP-dependent sacrificial sulfur transferase LarE [Proteobacteria bacterium]|nr:ATP-dependent sacrificial sulfur transferase LarE [Pseudomonadota bacterium]